MKKIWILCLIIICIGLVGCEEKKGYSQQDFVDISWTRTTEVDTEYLYFSSEGLFSYYCACGNPVDDSDLYEEYTYSSKNQTIQLIPIEAKSGKSQKLVIKYVDDETLKIDFDGEIREFQKEKEEQEEASKITYKNESYVLLECNADIFRYDYNNTIAWEGDVVYPIEHPEWKLVYVNGELLVREEDKEAAENYYSDENNYEWYFVIHEGDEDRRIPISASEADLEYIYQMDDLEKDTTLFFDDIEKFASLEKCSKDGIVSARISLAHYEGKWYWRSEVIDEKTEGWPEYVYELPKGIVDNIR